MSQVLNPAAIDREAAEARQDPFYYGTRWLPVTAADGSTTYQMVPLSQADFLDPQEGDQMNQGHLHGLIVTLVVDILRRYFAARADVVVFSDLKFRFGVPGLAEPAPDVAVVPGIQNPNQEWRSFDVAREGTRPVLIIEVVSKRYRQPDYVDKPPLYQAAGVAEYLLIDPAAAGAGPMTLTGWRLDPAGHYQAIAPAATGRLYSQTTDLYFATAAAGQTVVIEAAGTGERLLSAAEEAHLRRVFQSEAEAARQSLQAEAQRRRAAEQRAAAAERELARLQALLAEKRQANGDDSS